MSATVNPKTVLCIPGTWMDRSELVAQIAKLSGGYLFAGSALMETATERALEVEVCDHDPRMLTAFQGAGSPWRDTPEMAKIADHTMVLYLVGEGGSTEKARIFMKAAKGLLFAGGMGVKVESSGGAYSPIEWIRMTDSIGDFDAFVICVTGEETMSCGMHNLGLRDAVVDSLSSENPLSLIHQFNRYVYWEKPTLKAGQTFGVETGAPRYRLTEQNEQPYPDDSLYHNPYGMWRLTLVKP